MKRHWIDRIEDQCDEGQWWAWLVAFGVFAFAIVYPWPMKGLDS